MNQFGVNLIWISQMEYASGHRQRSHVHSYYHYIYILDGEGGICIGSEAFALVPNRLYLTPPETPHTFYNNTDRPLHTLELKFEVPDAALNKRVLSLPSFLTDKDEIIKRNLIGIQQEVEEKRLFSRNIVAATMYAFVFTLQRNSKEDENSHSIYERTEENLQAVFQYVQEHLAEEITLETLAAVAHLERTYFSKKFKKITGMPPTRYIRGIKIEKATDLLVYSDMSILQIAKALGFKNLQHFYNAFRRSTKESPRSYRKKYAVKGV